MASRTAPRPPRADVTWCAARADVCDGVGWGERQPGAEQHREVEQVVAHVGDLFVGVAWPAAGSAGTR